MSAETRIQPRKVFGISTGARQNWEALAQLLSKVLREQSKDLRLAAWYGEAVVRLNGFQGAVESCQLIHRLLKVYGARLHPRGDEGDHVPFTRGLALFDRCVAGALRTAPLLKGDIAERGFSLAEFNGASAARLISEAAVCVSTQRIDDAQQSAILCAAELVGAAAIAGAVVPCSFERLPAALDAWRTALVSIRRRAEKSVEVVRSEAIETVIPAEALPVPMASTRVQMPSAKSESLQRRELRFVGFHGEDSAESNGRSRFYQKLAAVEECIRSGRYRSARVLLSELVNLIDRLSLQDWEPRWAISTVYRSYLELLNAAPPESGDVELVTKFFDRWVRFDPNAAMEFEDRVLKNGPWKSTH